jgi:5-methylcytosine-specific restriction endonuclease McrA
MRRVDTMETEILQKDPTGKVVKVIVRKSQRAIDSFVAWKVFKRDLYTCRYCGLSGTPLTVDHVVLWEEGGPTIEENLITACKKCNKDRGNTRFPEWMDKLKKRNYYARVPLELQEKNDYVLSTLAVLEQKKFTNTRSR